jgi:hypothetical protein
MLLGFSIYSEEPNLLCVEVIWQPNLAELLKFELNAAHAFFMVINW